MINLPAPAPSDGPLAFARREVENARDKAVPIFGMSLRWFDKVDNRRLARQIMKWVALQHPTRMMVIADWARQGMSIADEALRELAVEYLDRGEQPPTCLAAYTMEVVARPARRIRGQKKEDNFLRDIAITIIVQRVAETFDIPPTGRSARRQSACAVVAEALAATSGVSGLSPKGVAEIWRRYGRI